MSRRVTVLVGLIGVLGSLLLPVQAAAADQAEAQLRFGNLSTSAGRLQVEVDGRPLGGPLAYGEVSDYVSVTSGTSTLSFLALDDPPTAPPVAAVDVVLAPGAAASAVVSGGARVRADVLVDDLSAPPAGQARVRVAHLAPGLPTTAARLATGSAIAEGLDYGEASGYTAVPSGSHELELLDPTGRVLITIRGLTLRAGSVYTFFGSGGGEWPVDVRGVVDAAGPERVPVGAVSAGYGGGASGSGDGAALLGVVAFAGAAGALLVAAVSRSGAEPASRRPRA